jgi:hypothetical protein
MVSYINAIYVLVIQRGGNTVLSEEFQNSIENRKMRQNCYPLHTNTRPHALQ